MVVTFPPLGLNTSQKTREFGFNLVQLWMAETGLEWARAVMQSEPLLYALMATDGRTSGGASVLPGNFFAGPGIELPFARWHNQKLVHEGHVKQADDIWLISRFLDIGWPQGGFLFIGRPESGPKGKTTYGVIYDCTATLKNNAKHKLMQ
jgi:hypothetical protein